MLPVSQVIDKVLQMSNKDITLTTYWPAVKKTVWYNQFLISQYKMNTMCRTMAAHQMLLADMVLSGIHLIAGTMNAQASKPKLVPWISLRSSI